VTTLLLARHGETDWNRDGRFQGHADPMLNELGRQQAQKLGLELRGEQIDAIWSSDLGRAKQTAFYIASHFGMPVRLSGELREMDVGSWSGLTREEIAERWPAEYAAWHETGRGWPDGEDFDAMQARVVDAVLGIAAAHPGQQVLVVTHKTLPEHRQLRGVAANCEVVRFAVAGETISAVD
jgi:broad specificity phosphatase PhoE